MEKPEPDFDILDGVDAGPPITFTILYPSGQSFVLTGTLVIVKIPNFDCCNKYHAECSAAIAEGTKVWLLDPRVIIKRGNKVVYSPRMKEAEKCLSPDMKAWMTEHSEWGWGS